MSPKNLSPIAAMLVAGVLGPATALAITHESSAPTKGKVHHVRHDPRKKLAHGQRVVKRKKRPVKKTPPIVTSTNPTTTTTATIPTGTTTTGTTISQSGTGTTTGTTTSTPTTTTPTVTTPTVTTPTVTTPTTTTPTTTTPTTTTPTTTTPTTTTPTTTTPTTTTPTTTTPTTTTPTTTTPTTTTPASVPDHIPTWAYDNCGTTAATSLVRQWVTYAENNCGPNETRALTDCAANGVTYCTSVEYLDADWIYAQGSVPVASSASENWWLHEPGDTDSAHRIALSAYGGGNHLNDSNPSVDSWFQNYVHTNYNGYGALFMDDTAGDISKALWGSGYSSSDEIANSTQLQAAHADMAAALTHSDGTPFIQFDNALDPNPNLASALPELNNPSSVVGMVAEGSPMYDGSVTSYYPSLLDEMAYIDHTSDDFATLLSYDTSGSSQARFVQEATILLGYSPGHTVDWADLETGTNGNSLAVWPEEGIVPTNPVQSMGEPGGSACFNSQGGICSTGGHNDLQVASGVYRREFAQCYNQGTAIGPCATIMNDTGSTVTVQGSWLTQSYGHQVTLNGGDVQNSGTISVAGASFTPGSTTVPADDAVLLSQ